MKSRLAFIVESGTDVRLVEGLAEHFEVRVIAREIQGGVEISHRPETPVIILQGPAGRARFARFVFRCLLRDRSRYDVVLTQGYGLAAFAANVARQLTGKPTTMLVCSPAEAYYKCRLSFPDGPPYREGEAVGIDLLARANALLGEQYVVLSEYLESVVRSHGAQRVHRIPVYGVDTATFAPPITRKRELKAQLGLPITGTLIFFSSRVAPEKDSETLLRAARRLLNDGHEIWLLHRSGGYRRFIADAEKFGISSRVIASDAVHPYHDLPLDYQACDMCVQASREEGLGFSPLEALSCETPVVATSVGGLRETIIDGYTGWTYPVRDDRALSRAILNVIANPDEALRRSRNGRRMVIDHFERHPVFARFATILQSTEAIPSTDQQIARRDEQQRCPIEILLATHAFRSEHTAVYCNTCQRVAYFESCGHRCTVITPDDFGFIRKANARFVPLLFPIALARFLMRQPEPFDVVMFHSYAGWAVSFLRRFFGKLRDLRIVLMFHGLEPLYYRRLKREVRPSLRYQFMHGFLMQRLLKFACRDADLLMCLNSEEASFLEAEGWSRNTTTIVANPCSSACLQIYRTFPERARRLLFIGQWLPMKGTRYLVEAFTKLHRRHSDLHLCCAGTLASEINVLASFPKDVAESVSVIPIFAADDLPSIVTNADLFLFPTLSEGASLALSEAMAGALPIVTTRVGAAPDLLKHEESVIFVPTANAVALADAVERLLDDRALREKLGRNARLAATSLYPSIVWRTHTDYIDKLMGWEPEPAAESQLAASAGGTN